MKIFHAIKRLLDIFLKKILVLLINLISLTQSSLSLLQIKLSTIIKREGCNESLYSENGENVKALTNALKYGSDVWTDDDIFIHYRRDWLLKNVGSYITFDSRPIEYCYSQTINSDGEEDNAENSANKENSDCDAKGQAFDVDSFKDISLHEKAPDAYPRTPQKRKSTANGSIDFAKRRRGDSCEQSNLKSDIEMSDLSERTEEENMIQESSPSQYDNRISDSIQISKDTQLLDIQLSSEMSQSMAFNETESNTNHTAFPEKPDHSFISQNEAYYELTPSSRIPMNLDNGVVQDTLTASNIKLDLVTDITSDNLNIVTYSRAVEADLHSSEYAEPKTCTSLNTSEDIADESSRTISEKESNYSSGTNCIINNEKESYEEWNIHSLLEIGAEIEIGVEMDSGNLIHPQTASETLASDDLDLRLFEIPSSARSQRDLPEEPESSGNVNSTLNVNDETVCEGDESNDNGHDDYTDDSDMFFEGSDDTDEFLNDLILRKNREI